MASEILPQNIWLTQTKLQPPRLRADIVPRPRLNKLLQQSVTAHNLTLISAPAGYGKTTLVTTLARETSMPVASLAGAGARGQQPSSRLHRTI